MEDKIFIVCSSRVDIQEGYNYYLNSDGDIVRQKNNLTDSSVGLVLKTGITQAKGYEYFICDIW